MSRSRLPCCGLQPLPGHVGAQGLRSNGTGCATLAEGLAGWLQLRAPGDAGRGAQAVGFLRLAVACQQFELQTKKLLDAGVLQVESVIGKRPTGKWVLSQ